MSATGSGLKAVRGSRSYGGEIEEKQFPPSKSAISLLKEEPDMTIGSNMKLKGNIRFEKLLRIDGSLEGLLEAPIEASVIVGDNGYFVGNMLNLASAYIEGKVIGDIKAESLSICSTAIIHGNITCKNLECAPDAMIIGNLNVDPFSTDFQVRETEEEEDDEQGDEE